MTNEKESHNKKFDWKDNTIKWKDIIKKEARGYEKGEDLGEVQEIGQEFVVTERGRLKKNTFYLPKYLVNGYDGETLWFNISEEEAEDNFKKDRPPKQGEYSRYKSASITQKPIEENNTTVSSSQYNLEEDIPLISKRNINPQTGATMTKPTGSSTNNTYPSGIVDWDSIIHKGARTLEMNDIGNVTAVTVDSIIITSEGAKNEYNIPKEEVKSYNGSEVVVNATIDRLDHFKVKIPR